MNIIPKISDAALALDPSATLDALLHSEAARKAVSDRQRDVLAFRTTAAKKLAELNEKAEQTFPELRKAREAANAEAIAAERRWREACNRAQQASNAVSMASHAHDAAMRAVEGQLLSTAHPDISLFLSEMDEAYDDCNRQFAYQSGADRNPVTGARVEFVRSNATSVEARKTAIREAKERAREMRLEPDQSTVPARLQELRSNLPAIEGI